VLGAVLGNAGGFVQIRKQPFGECNLAGCSLKRQGFLGSVNVRLWNIRDGTDHGRNFLEVLRGTGGGEMKQSIRLLSQRG
jgi:hypothetical protein